ncbi:MAG TPA: urease accessory protein UreD [Pseudonocardia sp.]|jgi:urease accessory protein|nr:urease accessory protein UreD [Pseudonocardia sp.]
MRARAELVVDRSGAGQSMRYDSAPPVVLRRTGPDRVHLIQAAGGPLGGDDLELGIRLGANTRLTVHAAGATVAQAGRSGSGPARWCVRAHLEPGARLCWWPEPTVVCDGADLVSVMDLKVAEGASALVREEVLLGRYGQSGGRYRGELRVDHGGTALVRHALVLDGADRVLSGVGGTGGHKMVTTVLGVGSEPAPVGPAPGERDGMSWACHDLAGPGWMVVAVSSGPTQQAPLRFDPSGSDREQPAQPGPPGGSGLDGDPGVRGEPVEAVEATGPHV